MGTAIDALINLSRERNARDKATSDSISNSLSGFSNQVLNNRKLQQQQSQFQQALALKKRQASIDELLAAAKIQKAQTESENLGLQSQLLNNFLKGGGGEGGGPVITSAKIGDLTLSNPAAKAEEAAIIAASKPLSGETANRFAGSTQGLGNIQDIVNTFQFESGDEGGITSSDFKELKKGLNNQRRITKLGVSDPTTVQGFLFGDFVKSDERFVKLENDFLLLAENQLRARTGAQAPEPEQIREEARTILQGVDSPGSLAEKLRESKVFLDTVATEIRPRSDKIPKFNISKKGNSDKSVKTFDTPQEADSAGLPTGTIVLVGGRRYQI